MSAHDNPVSILPESESWNLLAGVPLGRLVTFAQGQADIFPVNFVVQRRTLLFRTAGGTKLAGAAINSQVLFEADGYDDTTAWSVIVRGVARSLRSDDELADAEQAGLVSWTATDKRHYVRVRPTSITGRRFRLISDPASR